MLSDNQIKEIHYETLQLLESTGVRIMDQDAVQILIDAGCRIVSNNIVQIPNRLVEDCIRSAPSRITIYNRKGEEAMLLEGDKVHFGLGMELLETYDLKTGALRSSRLHDIIDAARISDYFEEIDFVASFAHPRDVPASLSYIESFKAEVENSIKPIFFTAAGIEDLAVIMEMAAAVAGGEDELNEKPFLIHYCEPTSPLSHSTGAVRKLFFCADRRIPVNYTSGMLSGVTGPVTLAGAITVANAEALSGIVLHQLRAKGAPIISGFCVASMDMSTAAPVFASPEYRLAQSACADLYHYYGIPVWGTAGVSDANCFDQQAGMEMAISLLMAALDGTNLVHGVGSFGQGLIGSPAAIVMCAEIISYVKRIIRGFDIGPDRIGMDVIRQVGPGGNFLKTIRTKELHRQEHWRPMFANRANLMQWNRDGRKTYDTIAIEKAARILKTHRFEPLPDEVRRAIDAIRKKAAVSLANTRFEA